MLLHLESRIAIYRSLSNPGNDHGATEISSQINIHCIIARERLILLTIVRPVTRRFGPRAGRLRRSARSVRTAAAFSAGRTQKNRAHRFARAATKRAIAGPAKRTTRNRAICIPMMKGMSTWVDAEMIATESAPPGLIAR